MTKMGGPIQKPAKLTKGSSRPGRPTKLTPERQAKVIEGISIGLRIESAANYAGVAISTVNDWRRKHPYFAAATRALERAAGALDTVTIARPAEGRWSIANILEHLTLAFRANRAAIDKALASGETRGRKPRILQAVGRVLVVDLGYFPRVEAPESTRPSGTIPPQETVAALREALAALDASLSRAADRFGEKARVANHPYFGGMTVPQWRKFHWRHTVHHMRQVRRRAAERR